MSHSTGASHPGVTGRGGRATGYRPTDGSYRNPSGGIDSSASGLGLRRSFWRPHGGCSAGPELSPFVATTRREMRQISRQRRGGAGYSIGFLPGLRVFGVPARGQGSWIRAGGPGESGGAVQGPQRVHLLHGTRRGTLGVWPHGEDGRAVTGTHSQGKSQEDGTAEPHSSRRRWEGRGWGSGRVPQKERGGRSPTGRLLLSEEGGRRSLLKATGTCGQRKQSETASQGPEGRRWAEPRGERRAETLGLGTGCQGSNVCPLPTSLTRKP